MYEYHAYGALILLRFATPTYCGLRLLPFAYILPSYFHTQCVDYIDPYAQ